MTGLTPVGIHHSPGTGLAWGLQVHHPSPLPRLLASGEAPECGCYGSTDNISEEVRCKEPPGSQARDPGSSLHAKPASRRLCNHSIPAFQGVGMEVASDSLKTRGHGGGSYSAARRSTGLATPSWLGVFLLAGSHTMI